jgi:hypothetical protein
MILHGILTTDQRPIDEILSDADQDALRKAEAVSAARKLVARARAVPERVEKQSYGQLWKAWAKNTAAYPEM